MKRIGVAVALVTILSSLSLFAQEEEGGGSDVSYLNTTTNQPVSYTGTVQNPCIFPTLPFDFEPVNGDATFDLDLVWGRSYESATVVHNANQRYNNGTGDYPNDNGTFFSATRFARRMRPSWICSSANFAHPIPEEIWRFSDRTRYASITTLAAEWRQMPIR